MRETIFIYQNLTQSHTSHNYLHLLEALNLSLKSIQLETKQGLLSHLLDKIDRQIELRKASCKRTVLHFVTVFSAPSETFIYDLVKRLDNEDECDNFVLYEHKKLPHERPYDKAIQVYWNGFSESLGKKIYQYIVDQLRPDVVVAHFALNEWKWRQRTVDAGISIPTISMCHGIDVFSMREKHDYCKYLIDDFSLREDTCFTVVSEYLRRELISTGVPSDKVFLLPNAVNTIYFGHRKTDNFYDRKRNLRLLAIGRLVAWKGHEHLLHALAIFRRNYCDNVHLTIVYGNGDQLLGELTSLSERLDLQEYVKFVPFVDLASEPEYFSSFDCFVHSSTYAKDSLRNSETFGVSVLEAITAGLPVISTDAGGLPEVIGNENEFAKLVPHANPNAMAQALGDMWLDGTAYTDNKRYALEKLEQFSGRKQISSLISLIETKVSPIKVALFSTSTIQGAGYAALRLHRGLRSTAINAHMYTIARNHETENDITVVRHPSGDNTKWEERQFEPHQGLTISTINQNHLSNSALMDLVAPYDIINLHWHARFLSVENISALTNSGKPVVMTIRDMMPITGGCHFFHGCERWMNDCRNCPQFPDGLKHIPGDVLYEKRKSYNFENLTLVAISNHSRELLRQVPFFNKCRIETIPNSIETDIFSPYDRVKARRELGLPLNRKIIGYAPSFSSEVKGYAEFVGALEQLDYAPIGEEPFVMLFGNDTPASQSIRFDRKSLGYINDQQKLAHAYSAADCFVVPSLEETFSNTTAEAISCGVPVVGFHTGAIPDLAISGYTGYTAKVGDIRDLAHGIKEVLIGPDLSKNCRSHANRYLVFEEQAKRYEALFTELIVSSREEKT